MRRTSLCSPGNIFFLPNSYYVASQTRTSRETLSPMLRKARFLWSYEWGLTKASIHGNLGGPTKPATAYVILKRSLICQLHEPALACSPWEYRCSTSISRACEALLAKHCERGGEGLETNIVKINPKLTIHPNKVNSKSGFVFSSSVIEKNVRLYFLRSLLKKHFPARHAGNAPIAWSYRQAPGLFVNAAFA